MFNLGSPVTIVKDLFGNANAVGHHGIITEELYENGYTIDCQGKEYLCFGEELTLDLQVKDMVKYRGRYVIITAINDNVATVEDNKFLFSEIPADELEFISRPSTGGEEISAALTKKGELTDYPMLNFSKPQRTRGFEAVTGYNPVIPTRATKGSAGYDICPIEAYDLKPGEAVVLNTGLKVYMLPDEYLAIHIRSSIGTKRRLRITNATGVIDSDYHNNPNNEGHIKLAIVNEGDFPYYIEADKPICQGIFTKYLTVDNDSVTTERTGGIGSTD